MEKVNKSLKKNDIKPLVLNIFANDKTFACKYASFERIS